MKMDDISSYAFNGYKLYERSTVVPHYQQEPTVEIQKRIFQFKDGVPVRVWRDFGDDEWDVGLLLPINPPEDKFIKNIDETDLFGILL